MKYRIFGKKLKHKYHLINPATGNSWCKAENNKQLYEPRDTDEPGARKLCRLCAEQSGESKERIAEPSLAVLMGEAIEVDDMPPPPNCRVRDAGTFLTIERGGRVWTLGKEYPDFERAKWDLLNGQ